MLAAVAVGVIAAAEANAAYYKMVACAHNNGAPPHSIATNTASSSYPSGIFHIWNFCTGSGGDPPGDKSFLRIQEHKVGGEAGNGAYGHFVFDTPSGVHFKAAGGYTRQPEHFNSGWRSRFWVASSCCTTQIITQGKGLPNSGGQLAKTGTFAPHLWPLEVYYDFTRFVFEMKCVNSGGCSTSGTNATDLNGLVFVLSDDHKPRVEFENTSRDLLAGRWVRGTQKVDFESDDNESGMRAERVLLDGSEHWRHDHGCNTSVTAANGEWAREYKPCPNNERDRHVSLDTADLGDGSHRVKVCVQDFGQNQGLAGTGGETCTSSRTIRTDNTAPGAPLGLQVTSANPERYLPQFGAKWSLPADPGSPIERVHYDVIDNKGRVVVPERSIGATNPRSISSIRGREERAAYRLRVWLEDEVGHVGPPAVAPIPRDTKPPAAPQSLSVVAPTTPKAIEGLDVRWRNISDAGSPVVAAHYRIESGRGEALVAKKTIHRRDPESIRNLETADSQGSSWLTVWLEDAEGNVGAPARVVVSHSCVRSPVRSGSALTAGLGEAGEPAVVVRQGGSSTLRGALYGGHGGVANAPLCVFSRVLSDPVPQFMGLAMTGPDGSYQFAIGAGPSREITAVYRPGQRELSARATMHTRVRPTLRLRRKVVRNKHVARFHGRVPGPNAENVLVVLQVKSGKAWRVFRRVRPNANGRYFMRYRFTNTPRPTVYIFRVQVRATGGYPYLRGNSRARRLRVIPERSRARPGRSTRFAARGPVWS